MQGVKSLAILLLELYSSPNSWDPETLEPLYSFYFIYHIQKAIKCPSKRDIEVMGCDWEGVVSPPKP